MGSARTDDGEFCDFVAACSPRLYRSALLLTARTHEAEDLVQATWVKSYVAWRRVRGAADPVAYVHGILLNTFRSECRRGRARELPVDSPPESLPAASPMTGPDERADLLAALSALSPTDRAVVVLRYWEDRTVAQTAEALHLTQAAVKNRSLRALGRLRDRLADHLPSPHEPAAHALTPETRSTP